MPPRNLAHRLAGLRTHAGSSSWILVTTTLATAVTTTLGEWLVSSLVGSSVQLLGFAIVTLTVLFGRRARWGIVLGVLGAGLLLVGTTVATTEAFAALVASVVCGRLWVESRVDVDWRAWSLRYAAAAIVTALAVGTATAWLAELLGTASFFISLSSVVAMNLPASIVGLPVAWTLTRLGDESVWNPSHTMESSRTRLLTTGAVSCWALVGAALSGFVAFARLASVEAIGRRLHVVAEVISRLAVANEQPIHVVVGLAALAVVFFLHDTDQPAD